MKTVYLLKHIHEDTEVVGVFTDRKKALQAFDLYVAYIQSRFVITNVEQAQNHEIRQEGYRYFRNGHILKLDESTLFTDIEQFKRSRID